jgi:DNA-binding transcriptional MerR regulator
MLEDQFLIHELAERARMTVRTIRYYTDEGLLPQPVTQGKYAYYTEVHLNRLELIRRMKNTYLPLREIREIMNSLTDEEVGKRLAEQTFFTPKENLEENPDQPPAEPGSNALQYISKLMNQQAGHRSEGTVSSSQPSPVRKKSGLLPEIKSNTSHDATSPPDGETWRRIALAPGVELHLLEPAGQDIAKRVLQLEVFAHKIFVRKNRKE